MPNTRLLIPRPRPPLRAAPPVRWPKRLAPAIRPNTEPISIRVDGDVLAWFRGHGPRYQTHIVAVLRAYVARQREAAS